MELALNEVKIQAKKLLKIIRVESNFLPTMELPLKRLGLPLSDEIQLKHCLTIVSHQLGFDNWRQAQNILSGNYETKNSLNMGEFFYPQGCNGLINEWFADYQQAKITLANNSKLKFLLPYKSQFIVVKKEYISLFKINQELMGLWTDINHNMVDSYNSLAWDKLTCEIIKNRSKNY